MVNVRAPGIVLAIAVMVVGTVACVSQLERDPATVTPTPSATPEPTATAEPTSTLEPTATGTPTPTQGPEATPTATATNIPVGNGGVQQAGLFVEIESLTDESVVRGDTVIARGQTVPDAVLSINSIIVPVQPDGTFEVLLSLEPGPNLIEVVASNLDGEELSRVIAVVSIPDTPTPTPTVEGGASS